MVRKYVQGIMVSGGGSIVMRSSEQDVRHRGMLSTATGTELFHDTSASYQIRTYGR